MSPEYRRPYGSPSSHSMRSARIDSYIGKEQGRMPNHYLQGDKYGRSSHPHPHPFSLAQSHDFFRLIHKEIEKERIRQEIIMSEILRRRALEAEMERVLALQGGSDVFHFGSPSRMGKDLPMRLPLAEAEGRFFEEKMMLSRMQMNNLSNRGESRLSESSRLQSASDNVRSVRNSEIKPLLEFERVKEEKKINLREKAIKSVIIAPKAIENITGAKRPSSELEYSNLNKTEKEWSCDICQVSFSSERALNDHLQGKKHNAKEAAVRAENSSIQLNKKKVGKCITGRKSEDKVTSVFGGKSGDGSSGTNDNVRSVRNSEMKPLLELESVKERKKINLQAKALKSVTVAPKVIENMTGEKRASSESEHSNLKKRRKKECNLKKRRKKEWSCYLCQVCASSDPSLNDHMQGKKHKAKEAEVRGSIELDKKKVGKRITVCKSGNDDGPALKKKDINVGVTCAISVQYRRKSRGQG